MSVSTSDTSLTTTTTVASPSPSSGTVKPHVIEPLLEEDQNRFVLFPIKDAAIWNMYKKQVDCFWRAEEVDLTKDIA